ncbi:MAG TPA: amino acid adenylation domain-containing protein, partial [Candidatus Binatia bacterium]
MTISRKCTGPIPRRLASKDGSLPLSFSQQRLWFLDRYEPNSSVYNVFSALQMQGSLEVSALERSFAEVARRHEALRTTVSTVGTEPVQVISPAADFSLSTKDISHLPRERREQEALRLAAEEARKPFELTRGPLFRATLIDLGSNEHMLLLTMHHIVSDGWSMGVLHRELSELYRAFTQGKSSPLGELPIQYADYAIWQREWLRGGELERQLSYWKKQLEGAPALLNFPTDRPRPAVQSFRGASQTITLTKELSEQLKALSRKQGVTLFMTLLAAFQTLLYRYTGQEDIVVGSPIANRTRSEIEGLIGFFVNTLVLRGRFGSNPTFRELLAETRRVALDAYEHQDLPFEKLVEELKPERSLSYSPLFQVMFVLQNAPERALSFEGVSVSRIRTGSETAKFDLTLSVHETAQGLTGSLQYNTDLFEAATITRLLKHFETLLQGIVDDPGRRIADLPILTEAERRELLEWNETKQHYPKDKCLHQLFLEQAKRTPGAIAVVFEGQQITYRELNQRANRLACRLQQSRVGPNVLVGLCAERSIELIVGILGILKAGGAYVPLDPNYPAARLEFMLKDSDVSVVVSQKHLAANFPADERTIVYLDTEPFESSSAEAFAASDLESETQPDSLAYVIYTSGSTGNPKGVLVSHYNVVRLFQSTQAWFDFNVSDVWALFHSCAFDFSVWEIWGALLHGGRLVIVPNSVSRAPDEFARLIEAHGVTILNQTPSAFRQLMPHLLRIGRSLQRSLRYVIFGGEALEPQTLRPWFSEFAEQGPRVINMYGITESTVHVTYQPMTADLLKSGSTSVIGKPLPDLSVYILDSGQRPQPVGVAGEIYIGGAGLARGYLRRPELTAERFIADPFSIDPQSRLYRSGDLARRLADGSLEYLGRIDDQVKIRGYRIELGEIEAALNQHAQVKEAIVIAREDTPGDKRLVAYIVMDDEVSVEELRRSLCGILPDYMVPSVLVRLRSFPLTSNGKVDRRSLPMPDVHRPDLAETYVAPRNAVEELLARLWGEVLKLESVGVHDNFFELGGHSLLATRVISRINDSFRTDIPLRRLFESPTIAELAAAIDLSRASERNGESISPIVPVARRDKIPLSFAQQRLWFLDRLTPQSAAYNVPAAFRLNGELKLHALQQSLNDIVRRHEVLRTVVATVNGEPIQKISPSANCPLIYADLTDRQEKEREACLRELVAEEAETPFDLSCGPLIRAKVLRVAPQDHALLLNMHHIVSDGWSMGLLFHELSAHYEAFCSGKPSPLPELPIQYADYSVWQRNWLQNEEEVGKNLSYWRKQLDGVSMLQLPTDYPRPTIQNYQGASRSLHLSIELGQALKELGQQEGVTLYMTLLAAFQVLLFRYSGESDIAVGSPIAGRTRQETESLIGFFVNTLVLRSDLSNDPIFTELLQRVRGTTLEAYSRQNLPFEKLVEELHPE